MSTRVQVTVCLFALVLAAGCGDDSTDDNQNNNNISTPCGNGVVESGEACDDGAQNSDIEPDACRTDCRTAYCGDGVKDTDEACDDGDDGHNGSDGCPDTCLAPTCGDGHVHAFVEQCDDGNTADGDDCRGDCGQDLTLCGDGHDDPGEGCDDGSANSDTTANACRENCQLPSCGDGVADDDHDEDCDGEDFGGDTCLSVTGRPGPLQCDGACALVLTGCYNCGNGTVESPEECDDGSTLNSDTVPDACRTDCREAWCGDDVEDTSEQCDDGSANSNTAPNACRTDCRDPHCGDLVIDSGEDCDGTNLGFQSCTDLGQSGGVLACSLCAWNYERCFFCGDDVCERHNDEHLSSCTATDCVERDCADLQDNDADGLADCDDGDCNGESCGDYGMACLGTSCICTGNPSTPQATESACDDSSDNDCDGDFDCADTDCDTLSCGGVGLGLTCSNLQCLCHGVNPTGLTETSCMYGSGDEDCDGFLDCADSDCNGQSCSTAFPSGPRTCVAGQCICGNGTCDTGEQNSNCPVDCYCGNGTCDPGELLAGCVADCTAG